jgi:hypothetical protein
MQILKVENAFKWRALSALGISLIADAVDYIAAPIFSTPIIGDISDVIVSSILFSITRSKVSSAINTIEFIPFIGDFIPVYTLSTLIWIYRESRKRNKIEYKKMLDQQH